MADKKHFGPEVKTVADATQDLEVKSRTVTTELSIDHAVFAEARKNSRGAGVTGGKTKPGGPPTFSGGNRRAGSQGGPRGDARPPRAPSPHIVRSAAAVVDPHATMAMPAVEKRKKSDSPAAKAQEPPEVSLTQHTLPESTLDQRLIMVAEPDSERAARFRILRHHLMEQSHPQVVVVSSPSPGEGKTTCAVNLALALAECGRARVLLVEASVRRPQLAGVFRFVPPWCFAEQLQAHRHQPLLPWGVVDLPDQWLHVAAVNPEIEQNQLLDAPAFAIAMERLRIASYDHIVIDAPAVLGSAEVNLIQDAADGVILTTKARSTTARTLRRAVEQLNPSKILGTVLVEI